MFYIHSRPIRIALALQLVVTLSLTAIGAAMAGRHGAISILLGGAIPFAAGIAFAWIGSLHRPATAGLALSMALRAEAIKIAVILGLLLLVLNLYKDVMLIGFIGAFVISVVIFSMAILIRDE
jgi:ATP synthase protein I